MLCPYGVKKMKKIYLLLTAILFPILFTAQTEPDQDMKVEFRDISKAFMGELKSVLMKNLKEGGPVAAINVCADTAQALTSKIADEYGVELKRTTFKARNMQDTPDKFEEKVLLNFEEQYKKGELTNNDDYIEIVEVDSNKFARYMKPLFVQGPCLLCHGDESKMSEDVKELLKQKYPDDKALGYKAGDLRGAISITKKLN